MEKSHPSSWILSHDYPKVLRRWDAITNSAPVTISFDRFSKFDYKEGRLPKISPRNGFLVLLDSLNDYAPITKLTSQ